MYGGHMYTLARTLEAERAKAPSRADLLAVEQLQQLLHEFGVPRDTLRRERVDAEQLAVQRRERRITQDQAVEARDHPGQERRVLLHDRVLLGREQQRALEERPVPARLDQLERLSAAERRVLEDPR